MLYLVYLANIEDNAPIRRPLLEKLHESHRGVNRKHQARGVADTSGRRVVGRTLARNMRSSRLSTRGMTAPSGDNGREQYAGQPKATDTRLIAELRELMSGNFYSQGEICAVVSRPADLQMLVDAARTVTVTGVSR